jgi:hypothetical protein
MRKGIKCDFMLALAIKIVTIHQESYWWLRCDKRHATIRMKILNDGVLKLVL